jgi:hypothetical protein
VNIPFNLALSHTSPYGLLWNPHAASVADSVDNTILSNLSAEDARLLSLSTLPDRCLLTGFTLACDDNSSVSVSIGYWDVTASAFVELDVQLSTLIKGGVLSRYVGDGLLYPLSATRVPCIKFLPGSGSANVAGSVEVTPLSEVAYTVGPDAPTIDLIDEEGAFVLDETDGRIQEN